MLDNTTRIIEAVREHPMKQITISQTAKLLNIPYIKAEKILLDLEIMGLLYRTQQSKNGGYTYKIWHLKEVTP